MTGPRQPAFLLHNIPIEGDLVLAPMSGYNDQMFRRLCRRYGASLTYTGLLAANAIVYGPLPLGTARSEAMLRLHPDEKPLVCQLFGYEPETLIAAALAIEPLGMDAICLNLGCPEPKVTKGGAGAALLREPARIERIVAGLTRALRLPVVAKMRLGWDQASRNYLEVARILEDNGAALIAVHGRTAEQAYLGDADWDAIAEVKRAVRVPVLASGDVKCAADIPRLKARTACDGVMIGRAAIGNPWIFACRDRADVPWAERVPVIIEHLRRLVELDGGYRGLQRFQKHLRGYMQQTGLPRAVRRQILLSADPAQLEDALLLSAAAPLDAASPDEDAPPPA